MTREFITASRDPYAASDAISVMMRINTAEE